MVIPVANTTVILFVLPFILRHHSLWIQGGVRKAAPLEGSTPSPFAISHKHHHSLKLNYNLNSMQKTLPEPRKHTRIRGGKTQLHTTSAPPPCSFFCVDPVAQEGEEEEAPFPAISVSASKPSSCCNALQLKSSFSARRLRNTTVPRLQQSNKDRSSVKRPFLATQRFGKTVR